MVSARQSERPPAVAEAYLSSRDFGRIEQPSPVEMVVGDEVGVQLPLVAALDHRDAPRDPADGLALQQRASGSCRRGRS